MRKEEGSTAIVFKGVLKQVRENLSTGGVENAPVDLENMIEKTKEHSEMEKEILLAKYFEEDQPYLHIGKDNFVSIGK